MLIYVEQVMLGGGRIKFLPNNTADFESGNGERSDGVNLIDEWKTQKINMSATPSFVWNRDQLLNTNISQTDYLMGKILISHSYYKVKRVRMFCKSCIF